MVGLIPLVCGSAMADAASDAKLQQELREIRQELNALKSKNGGGAQQPPAKGGLKTENLGGRQVSAQTLAPSAAAGGGAGGASLDSQIPPELMKQLQESLGKMKEGQADRDKFVQELDKEIK